MRGFLAAALFLLPISAWSSCDWSSLELIRNEYKLQFQECKKEKKLKIGSIEVEPTIEFELIGEHWPEVNMIWSKHSPDESAAVVWIENANYERNAWVIDLITNRVKMFSDNSEGRHYFIELEDNFRFRIIHAGMGYRTDYLYELKSNNWINTGKVVHDIEL